jgi:hypothetical protein
LGQLVQSASQLFAGRNRYVATSHYREFATMLIWLNGNNYSGTCGLCNLSCQ